MLHCSYMNFVLGDKQLCHIHIYIKKKNPEKKSEMLIEQVSYLLTASSRLLGT